MQEIEPEEQAGDLLIDETLFEDDEDDLPKEQLRNTSAASQGNIQSLTKSSG